MLDKKNKGGVSLVLRCSTAVKENSDCPFYAKLRRSKKDDFWYICQGLNKCHNCNGDPSSKLRNLSRMLAIRRGDLQLPGRTRLSEKSASELSSDKVKSVYVPYFTQLIQQRNEGASNIGQPLSSLNGSHDIFQGSSSFGSFTSNELDLSTSSSIQVNLINFFLPINYFKKILTHVERGPRDGA